MVNSVKRKKYTAGFRAAALVTVILATFAYAQYEDAESPVVKTGKIGQVHSIALLPVELDWYHLTAGGVREYNDQMSQAVRALVAATTKKKLVENGFTVVVADTGTALKSIMKNIKPFFSAVNSEILDCVYSPSQLPDARDSFSYFMPPLNELCDRLNVEAVLLLDGFDDRSTARREKLKTGAAAAAVVGAILSGVVSEGIPEDRTVLYGVLALRTGEIVWYNFMRRTGEIEMAEAPDVRQSVSALLTGLKRGAGE